MNFSVLVVIIFLFGRGFVITPAVAAASISTDKLPVHQASPPRTSTVTVFAVGSTTELGPIPKQQLSGKLASTLSSSEQYVAVEKQATAPRPPQGPTPVTHDNTGSDSVQQHHHHHHYHHHHQSHGIDSNTPSIHHTQSNLAGPASSNSADSSSSSTSTTVTTSHATDVIPSTLGPNACEAGGDCAALGEAIVSAAEGPECRALHITGKCSAKCLSSLKEALAHKLWNACVAKCEIDVVTGAAHRWAELCEARQPTLLDASKEALTIVAAAPGAGRAVQLVILFGILVTALGFGYRRGMLQNIPLRLQKRLKRRTSERSLV